MVLNKRKKLSTGIPGFNTKIGGGLPSDGIGISIAGPYGLGKRIFCMQILYEALKRGEPGMYVSVDNHYFEIIKFVMALYTDGYCSGAYYRASDHICKNESYI